MTAASPGLASKTPSMPLLASDSVWHFSNKRKQLSHLIKEPPCSCGAGPNAFSFIYENANETDSSPGDPSVSLIPTEYKLYKHPGVLGLEPIEDKYSVRTKPHPGHMTVFPSMKPVSRREVLLLRGTLHDMLDRLRREEEKASLSHSTSTHLHELMDVVKKEQDIYNTVFHEIIRQVSIHCLEQGQLLSELREQYSSLFSRVPREIRGLHDELVAQRAIDRRLAAEIKSFQTRVSSLTGELDSLKQHEVKVSVQAVSAQEDLSRALTESEKNAGLLTEYHELYELQRRRLEGVTLKITSEKELWQQTSYDLALKVSDEFNLYTVRQLQLREKNWHQLATHFVVLLSQNDSQRLFDIEQQVNEWKEEFNIFVTELDRRETRLVSALQHTIADMNACTEFLQEYLDADGFRRYPEVARMRDMWESVRLWEQQLSQLGDFFNGEPLVSLQGKLKQVQKRIEAWTQICLRVFQFHPGRLVDDHSLMESTNQEFFSYQRNAEVRVSGENGVADGLMHVTTPLENWSQKLSVMIGNLEKHIPDLNWVKFQTELSDWSRDLEAVKGCVGAGVAVSADEQPGVNEMSAVVKAIDKWLESLMTSVDKENDGCGDQVTSLHSNLTQFMIRLLLKLTESITSDLVPSSPELTASDINIRFTDVLHELTAITGRIVANCTDLTAEISGRLREAGTENPDEEMNELKRFQSETSEWRETARKLIEDITAIEREEIAAPKLERSTRTIGNQETDDNMELKLNSDTEISAICADKNARSLSIEQLTADTEVPQIASYLEGTELPSSHAIAGIDTENVVKELGEANSRVSQLESRIGQLEVELKSSKTAEQQAMDKITQLEDLVEQSKPKSPSKQGAGKTAPKRVPSSHGRTSVTPSRAAK